MRTVGVHGDPLAPRNLAYSLILWPGAADYLQGDEWGGTPTGFCEPCARCDTPPSRPEPPTAAAAALERSMFLTHLVIAFVASFIYCSFLEWVLHKHFMHSTQFMREPFERHAVQHHGMHRSCRSFFADRREEPHYMLIGASFFPILWLLHLPLFAAVEFFVARGAGIGVGLGTVCYCLCYEVIHWCEHVPRNRWFERTRWFQFLLEHHRVHHKYARKNYNVVLPLADWLFGTLSFERLPPEPAEPVIPDRIKSWLGGGSRMGQKPGRRNPALAGRGSESAQD